MKKEIQQRLSHLRSKMAEYGIDAYVIPSADPHLSEYPPECWKARAWISGFNGSAGTVIVTADKAGLWTDSRYFLQATAQLEGTTIELYKMGEPETPSMTDFLRTEARQNHRVAFYGRSMSIVEAESFKNALSVASIEVVTDKDLVGEIQDKKPELPMSPFFVQPIEYAGMSVQEKVANVRKALEAKGANTIILTMLDEVAWLFNVRGKDVAYNPVAIAYGLITPDDVRFYTFACKVPDEVRKHLTDSGVVIKGYEDIYEDISKLSNDSVVCVDPMRTNLMLFERIPTTLHTLRTLSPITLLKAVKNEAEYQGCLRVMHRDGVSLTRFFIWLEKALEAGETPDEVEIGERLAGFRAQGDLYVSDSFGTIAGYNAHGAIVHYSATKETAYKLKRSGILLLDSGAQYHDGTTDITRTISLDGKPTAQQKADYTRVLKGHIALATAIYPQGTRGSQLDILARKALWDQAQNFGHGSGHGVGHFLNVHEGPQNIRMEENPTVLVPGMMTSNEPGIYIANEYGIRIENLIRTILYEKSAFGQFYTFETVTLCYMDNTMVDTSLLTQKELKWYNDYQERVYNSLAPSLNEEERVWLRNKTVAIS